MGDGSECNMGKLEKLADFFNSKGNLKRLAFFLERVSEVERDEYNHTCMGPLRPTTLTRLTVLLASSAKAYSDISVFRKTSISVNNVLATSRATFPWPIITASSPVLRSGARSRYSGRPLYHPTNA